MRQCRQDAGRTRRPSGVRLLRGDTKQGKSTRRGAGCVLGGVVRRHQVSRAVVGRRRQCHRPPSLAVSRGSGDADDRPSRPVLRASRAPRRRRRGACRDGSRRRPCAATGRGGRRRRAPRGRSGRGGCASGSGGCTGVAGDGCAGALGATLARAGLRAAPPEPGGRAGGEHEAAAPVEPVLLGGAPRRSPGVALPALDRLYRRTTSTSTRALESCRTRGGRARAERGPAGRDQAWPRGGRCPRRGRVRTASRRRQRHQAVLAGRAELRRPPPRAERCASADGRALTYLLDTNVASERRKTRPDPNVAAWFESTPSGDVHLSVLVVGEIRHGLEILRRRADHPQAMRSRLACSTGGPSCRAPDLGLRRRFRSPGSAQREPAAGGRRRSHGRDCDRARPDACHPGCRDADRDGVRLLDPWRRYTEVAPTSTRLRAPYVRETRV
jgi:hypothetical protein